MILLFSLQLTDGRTHQNLQVCFADKSMHYITIDIEILCIGIGNPRKAVHRRAVSEGVVHTRGQCRDMWCLVDVRHDDDNTGQQLATYSRAVTCVNRENCIRKVNSSPSTLHHEGGWMGSIWGILEPSPPSYLDPLHTTRYFSVMMQAPLGSRHVHNVWWRDQYLIGEDTNIIHLKYFCWLLSLFYVESSRFKPAW